MVNASATRALAENQAAQNTSQASLSLKHYLALIFMNWPMQSPGNTA